jgi:hypothetical protein
VKNTVSSSCWSLTSRLPSGDLHAHRRHVRLPAEAADRARLLLGIPHEVDAPGDAVAVGVVGIGERA